MKKKRLAGLLFLGAGFLLSVDIHAEGYELGSHGYWRIGGGKSDGNTQVCFKAPGAGAKYRLGNECETYGKTSIFYRHQPEKEGAYLLTEVMPEFKGAYSENVKFIRNVQAYGEIGNIASTPIDVWIGRRYNQRRDIHINDFFYMNLWGEGLGVRDIPLGAARLAVTYTEDRQVPTGVTGAGGVVQRNLDFSLYEVQTNPGGKIMADLRHARILSEHFGATQIHGVEGWALSLQHRQEGVLGGTNTTAIQYGRGAGRAAWSSNAESASSIGMLTTAARADGLEDAKTWRLLDFHVFDSERWAMMTSGLIERKNSQGFDGTGQTWASLGARPIFFLNERWRLVGELGYDRVNGRLSHGWLLKQTLAIEWAPKRSFLSRPAFRGYLTHANWSDSYRGQVGTPAFAQDTQGWSTGVQMEAWW